MRMYMCLCGDMCICVQVPMEVSGIGLPWYWSHTQLQPAHWVLGNELRFPGKAESPLNHWAIPPSPL